MAKQRIVVFCGGGTVGHVAPSIAVASSLKAITHIEPLFICAWNKSEKAFIQRSGYTAVRISAPKFPRGVTLRWLSFPMLFLHALFQSFALLLGLRPAVVFSKGGFVSVPVCLAAAVLRIPIVLHESDAATGLGNKLVTRLAARVCHGFPRSVKADQRHVFTGNPVRPGVLLGNRAEGLKITGFTGAKPVLLMIGGSQGAESLNRLLIDQLRELLPIVDVVHLTGKGKSSAPGERLGYWHAEFVERELPHLYALADLAITRAGAGVLSELAAVKKPAIVVPLEGVAHDHQVKNAQVLASTGAVLVLKQEDGRELAQTASRLLADKKRLQALAEGLHAFFPMDADKRIADVLRAVINGV